MVIIFALLAASNTVVEQERNQPTPVGHQAMSF
jgi:hypothetical protein